MADLLNGMSSRTLKAIWRDKAHGELLSRMQKVAKAKNLSLFSDDFAKECLGGCITRDHLHKVFTGKQRFLPKTYVIVNARLNNTESALRINPGRIIKWWELEN